MLIFVFDVLSKSFQNDVNDYKECVEAMKELSPNAWIFCLVHKMDLVQEGSRQETFAQRRITLDEATPRVFKDKLTFFATSIWDETLY